MNGRDLEAFLRVVGDPKKREQVAQKMREQGMSDKDVKKAEKEAQEFSRLKQIEKMRELTDDEKKRLDEINKSEQFQKYTSATAEVAKEYGVNLPTMKTEVAQRTLKETKDTSIINKRESSSIQAAHSSLDESSQDDAFSSAAPLTPPKGISAAFNTAQTASSNVVDLKQVVQERAMSEPVSNLDLIRENKAELLEPKAQKQPTQVIQVASAPSATAGLNF